MPAPGRQQQQQQQKLLNIIERLLSYGARDNNHGDDDDDDDADGWSRDTLMIPAQSGWRHVVMQDADDAVDKRSWSWHARGDRPLKRGPGMCINSCLTGGMSFVRCKSMCH